MKKQLFCTCLLIHGFLPLFVTGYPIGFVGNACGSMMPIHNASAQSLSAPYAVTASQANFNQGNQITVTLQAISGIFEGFLLEACQINGNTIVGTFTLQNSTISQTLQCSGAVSSISHTFDILKSQVKAIWTAPNTPNLGNVEFRVTFVQNFTVFWVNVKSSVLPSVFSKASTTVPNTVLLLSVLTAAITQVFHFESH
ncbi:putative ferric-chelate reductase 1 [Erpetoichthys calabaricus]|uniref:putative ferric-chelate reductase 1 n=1 Tax=Erpetoichthys calabaricus TaxID=27687 RepID=UPI0022342181|nr:putative ferric-chelate reductase 1 [Erpetoichthys calabaricus]